jgi:hypothetical protein
MQSQAALGTLKGAILKAGKLKEPPATRGRIARFLSGA